MAKIIGVDEWYQKLKAISTIEAYITLIYFWVSTAFIKKYIAKSGKKAFNISVS